MTKRLALNHPNRHMTANERSECVVLYLAGLTRDSLAEKYGFDRRTIDRLLKRNNALKKEQNDNSAA